MASQHGQPARSKNAFTLIELLVVISIIALLSSVVMASLNAARAKARDAKRLVELGQIVTALELYYNQFGYYPTWTNINGRCNADPAGQNSLNALVTSGAMKAIPTDPVNNNSTPHRLCYEYISIGNAAAYSDTSGWFCQGTRRTDYQYTIVFSTEVSSTRYPLLASNSGGTPSTEYKYCIPGPLR